MSIYAYFYEEKLLYIGSTINIKQRQSRHKSKLNNDSQMPFYIYLKENNLTFADLDIEIVNTDITDELELRRAEGKVTKLCNPECNLRIEGRTKKEYREDNKEKIKIKSKIYNENNKESKKEYNKTYNQNNKESIRANKLTYKEDNKEIIIEKRKKHYENNRVNIISKNILYAEKNKEKKKEYDKIYSQKRRLKREAEKLI